MTFINEIVFFVLCLNNNCIYHLHLGPSISMISRGAVKSKVIMLHNKTNFWPSSSCWKMVPKCLVSYVGHCWPAEWPSIVHRVVVPLYATRWPVRLLKFLCIILRHFSKLHRNAICVHFAASNTRRMGMCNFWPWLNILGGVSWPKPLSNSQVTCMSNGIMQL